MIEYKVIVDGKKIEWYLDGKLHREDGPAIEYTNVYKWWYLNGKLHRIDGPAIEYTNGEKSWYLNGKKVTEKEVMGKKEYSEEYLKNILVEDFVKIFTNIA